jgi:S-adenosylmethionine decarboxylase proenzyme
LEKLGCLWAIELYGCESTKLDNIQQIEEVLVQAAKCCKATIVNKIFHKFSPQGVSGVILIAESHISVHTWPEYGYAACDIFTCNNTLAIDKAISLIKEEFKAADCKIIKINRGEKKEVISYLEKEGARDAV